MFPKVCAQSRGIFFVLISQAGLPKLIEGCDADDSRQARRQTWNLTAQPEGKWWKKKAFVNRGVPTIATIRFLDAIRAQIIFERLESE